MVTGRAGARSKGPAPTRSGLAALAVAALLLSGCGFQRGGPARSASDVVPDPMTALAEVSLSPDLPLEPSAHSEDVRLPWALLGTADGGRALSIQYVKGDGSCVIFTGATVEETDQLVVVTVLARRTKATGCPSRVLTGTGDVELDKRLGGRQLFHGPVDNAWRASAPKGPAPIPEG